MTLLILSFASALLHWYSLATKQKKLEYFAKPTMMIFLILWYIANSPPDWNLFSKLILIGLLLSLAGDIFLMLPSKWFLAGLIAFLLAHIAYIGGIGVTGFTFDWMLLISATALLVTAVPIFIRLRKALIDGGNNALVIPVLFYVIIISIMVFFASSTLFIPDWPNQAGLIILLGAIFFFISDALLAWNRFVTPLPQGRLISIIPYHLAQYFIAFGVLLQLGSV